jgi:hypothetical protein
MSHLTNRCSSGTYTHTLYSVSTMGPGVPSHIQMNAPGTSNSCSKATKTWIPYGKEYWNGWSRKLKLCLGRSTCHLKGCFRISMVMFCFDHYASVPYFDFFFSPGHQHLAPQALQNILLSMRHRRETINTHIKNEIQRFISRTQYGSPQRTLKFSHDSDNFSEIQSETC